MRIPKASEFFITGIDGTSLSAAETKFLSQHRLGGVILFKRNIDTLQQVVELNTNIIESHAHPPFISVDQEGGRVARLSGICTDVPPLLSMIEALSHDPRRAYRMGAMQGRELVSLGFSLNFAPVCDVMSNQENEVIGDRAFSTNADETALLAAQYIKGLQGAGVAACAKHFPGHGATTLDSHLALPVIDTDLPMLHARELLPFKHAILANAATIMTAHIVTKPLDSLPATMSERTINELLRKELGYSGVVISDDLDMKAVADNYALKDIIEKSFRASVDMFIVGNNWPKTIAAIDLLDHLIATDEAIRAHAIASAERIAHIRERYIGKPLAPDGKIAQTILRCRPHLELIKEIN